MALRAEAIELQAHGPIGAVQLKDLAVQDLIVVTGPNGAGKTVLTQPLEAPGSAGSLTCIDESGAQQEYKSRGVQQSITHISSTHLMSGFRDLQSALALAAHATRELHGARILGQLANTELLKTGAAEGAQAEPATITSRRDAFAMADRQCGAQPRTLSEYRRLGRELSGFVGRAWEPSDLADGVRVPNEMQLQPEHRVLEGYSQVRPALEALASLGVPASGQPTAADAHREAAVVLEASISDALKQMGVGLGVAPSEPLEARASHALDALDDAIRATDDAIAALDMLRDCKRRAYTFVERQLVAGAQCDACPVCERPIAGKDLKDALSKVTQGQDPEAAKWQVAKKSLEALRSALHNLTLTHGESAKAAQREHAAVKGPIAKAAVGLCRAAGWAATVVAATDPLHAACDRWLAQHGSGPSEVASRDARTLQSSAKEALAQLDHQARQLNDGLERWQAKFQAFQRLGTVLAIREGLDSVEWTVSLDHVESERRRQEQRARWRGVLGSLADEYRRRDELAKASVIDDPGVQERFARLIRRLAVSQPGMTGLSFRGSSVTDSGHGRPAQLSEGQTVLVNIAAAIAVAGKVAGTAAHRPGWITFDEPTNGLDESSRDAVADYLGSITTADLPSQIFVTTFDVPFATRLVAAGRSSGRRVRHFELPPFVRGQPVRITERIA